MTGGIFFHSRAHGQNLAISVFAKFLVRVRDFTHDMSWALLMGQQKSLVKNKDRETFLVRVSVRLVGPPAHRCPSGGATSA